MKNSSPEKRNLKPEILNAPIPEDGSAEGVIAGEGEERKRNCIFFLPYPLEKSGNRARQLRPRKILYAFKELGYRVFLIQGYSAKRKQRIQMLKEMMEEGVQFDFLYGELNTEPLSLSDPNHLPTHPMMDFQFFSFLKSKGIPMGLFYCDVYWRFPVYKEALSPWKSSLAIHFYEKEMKNYTKLLDRLYVPDLGMCRYIDMPGVEEIAEALPPGGDPVELTQEKNYAGRDFDRDPLEIFYVGGITNHYRIEELLAAAKRVPQVRITLCTRENEWTSVEEQMEPYLTDRVTVIHKSEDELGPCYEKADLGSLIFAAEEYWSMAQPVKAYEYLCHGLPVLATRDTAIGKFVEKYDFGWTMEDDREAIIVWLEAILRHPEWLAEKREKAVAAIPENLWTARARQVAEGLTAAAKEKTAE